VTRSSPGASVSAIRRAPRAELDDEVAAAGRRVDEAELAAGRGGGLGAAEPDPRAAHALAVVVTHEASHHGAARQLDAQRGRLAVTHHDLAALADEAVGA
jgi:hypothetical protein